MTKKRGEPEKAILAEHFAGVYIFEVEFESEEQTAVPAEKRWIPNSYRVLDFDAQAAIDKAEARVTKEWKEKFRLLSVRPLARADL